LWQQVKTSLQAGKIRMLFVAERIPPELRRIVEFLNQQMDPAEMLALELRQFVGEGLRTIVPQVYGQTEEARGRKSLGTPIDRTIAALRAHKTRWEQKLRTAAEAERGDIEAKIADYDARIAQSQAR
jgi:hypothetical protein